MVPPKSHLTVVGANSTDDRTRLLRPTRQQDKQSLIRIATTRTILNRPRITLQCSGTQPAMTSRGKSQQPHNYQHIYTKQLTSHDQVWSLGCLGFRVGDPYQPNWTRDAAAGKRLSAISAPPLHVGARGDGCWCLPALGLGLPVRHEGRHVIGLMCATHFSHSSTHYPKPQALSTPLALQPRPLRALPWD